MTMYKHRINYCVDVLYDGKIWLNFNPSNHLGSKNLKKLSNSDDFELKSHYTSHRFRMWPVSSVG